MTLYCVITQVGEPKRGGNLALPQHLYVQAVAPSEENDYLGRYEHATAVLGMTYVALRQPVFRLGEVLEYDGDRDIFGRAPGKWDLQYEVFTDPLEAFARARAVRETAGVLGVYD